MLKKIKNLSLSQWILVFLILGILFGWFLSSGYCSPETTDGWLRAFKMISGSFLHLVKCIVVPLIFSTLVVGIAGHSDDIKAVGRMALKSIIYFEIATTAALVIGLCAVNLFQPGVGVVSKGVAHSTEAVSGAKVTIEGVIEHLTPQSFFDSAARNDVLQVVIYALLFGIALAQVKAPHKQTMLAFFEGVTQVMFKFTGLVMKLAPFGVGAAIAATIGQNGLGILKNLGALVFTLYGALIVFVLLVLIPVMLITRIPVGRFFRTIREPALLAFTTANSEAALPDAMLQMKKFGVPSRIVSFVLPAGYSFNLDGSTLHLAIASVFVAQAAGIQMDLQTQITMMLTLMLTSKGVAAVPRATLVILAGTVATFGLPPEGIGIILGVDAFLDMARTSVNLTGNCLASAVVARWEGELNIPESEDDPDDEPIVTDIS